MVKLGWPGYRTQGGARLTGEGPKPHPHDSMFWLHWVLVEACGIFGCGVGQKWIPQAAGKGLEQMACINYDGDTDHSPCIIRGQREIIVSLTFCRGP